VSAIFNFDLPRVSVVNRAAKFESQFTENCSNLLYYIASLLHLFVTQVILFSLVLYLTFLPPSRRIIM